MIKSGSLVKQLVQQFEAMTNAYLERYPVSQVEFSRSYAVGFKTYLKALLGIAYFIFYCPGGKKRKYYFQGLRNQAVLDLFPPNSIGVIGGVEERFAVKSKGYKFIWSGGLVSAILLASKRKLQWPLRLQVEIFRNRFSGANCWFFLIEDTLPVGSSFALLGNVMNKPTILLQHGFITGTEIMIDGSRCRHVVLYNKLLYQYMNAENAQAYELGPAFDIKAGNAFANEIILVGTGGKGYEPEQYFKALRIFASILSLLTGKWTVYYRPQPNEDPEDFTRLFQKIDTRSAAECLSGEKKIFIGFVSTLLYEARFFGHGVVAIKDPAEPALLYRPDAELSCDNIDLIVPIVSNLRERFKGTDFGTPPPLSQRFSEIAAQIEMNSR